jgi:Zn-dependent protease/predicted transcriptional regulator
VDRVRGTLRIGRLGGVQVQVHWSVLLIFALIAWSLSTATFPSEYPRSGGPELVVAGLVAAVVFLLALLAHEASHATVARHHGIEVDSITLWLFGGVAQLRGKAATPGVELRVAGVGPLVSLLLGAAFGILAAGLRAVGITGPLVGACAWLAGVNVLLAVFNAIPAAPLDGGRILRAALWQWRGDPFWATVTAARAGRMLGIVLMVVGLYGFLRTGGISPLWLGFIGWFLAGAATAEEQQALLEDKLTSVRVGDVMTPHPDTAPADITVQQLIDDHLFQRHHSTFPLLDDGHLVGLVTLRRLKSVPAGRRALTTAREIACPIAEVPVATPGTPLSELVPHLNASPDGRALVLEDGRLVGVVSPTDVSRAIEHGQLRSVPPHGTRGRGPEISVPRTAPHHS